MKKNSERSAAMRFTMKLSILLTPFIALLVVYFLNDPFMVLRHYNRYDNSPVMLNEGYIGWQMYMNNRDSIAFDSFIMGNSCTMAYQCHEWEKYLDGGRAVRLFGNAESIAAISKKLQALERNGAEIKNLLLILDKESLGKDQLLSSHNHVLSQESATLVSRRNSVRPSSSLISCFLISIIKYFINIVPICKE